MSIFVAQLVPQGILFGADRNITTSVQEGDVVASGQSQRPKVLKWPNHEIVIGYVGRAAIEGRPLDEWLYDFIGRNLDGELDAIAHELKNRLEFDLANEISTEGMILHLGGFVADRGHWKPQVWFIRNIRGLDEFGRPEAIVSEFDVSEEIAQPIYFGDALGDDVRTALDERARAWNPFWFHQGYDLGTFNAFDQVLRLGMRAVVETHPAQPHRFPDSLAEWSKHLEMAILTYGAYFTAFYEPFQQYVGGGADVVYAEWPHVAPF